MVYKKIVPQHQHMVPPSWPVGSKRPWKVWLESSIDIILALNIWGPLGPGTGACSEQADRALDVAVRAHPPPKIGMGHANRERHGKFFSTTFPLQRGPYLSSLI